MTERQINLVSKPLCDFSAGDTIYIKKNKSGYARTYLCQFVSLHRGNVVVKIIGIENRMLSPLEVGESGWLGEYELVLADHKKESI